MEKITVVYVDVQVQLKDGDLERYRRNTEKMAESDCVLDPKYLCDDRGVYHVRSTRVVPWGGAVDGFLMRAGKRIGADAPLARALLSPDTALVGMGAKPTMYSVWAVRHVTISADGIAQYEQLAQDAIAYVSKVADEKPDNDLALGTNGAIILFPRQLLLPGDPRDEGDLVFLLPEAIVPSQVLTHGNQQLLGWVCGMFKKIDGAAVADLNKCVPFRGPVLNLANPILTGLSYVTTASLLGPDVSFDAHNRHGEFMATHLGQLRDALTKMREIVRSGGRTEQQAASSS